MSDLPQVQQSSSAVGAVQSSAASSANSSADSNSSASVDSSATFRSLGLCASLCSTAAAAGWKSPTALQRAVLPALLSGRDIMCVQGCGSGRKTAFGLALMHRLLQNPRPLFALIIEPTRSLAHHACAQLTAMGSDFGLRCATIVGGELFASQVISLNQRPHILVSTPGRLLDLLDRCSSFTLQSIEFFVLDAADHVLNIGFEEEIQRIVEKLPKQRTSCVFTTTCSEKLNKLQQKLLHDPLTVDLLGPRRSVTPQTYLFIPAKFKDVYVFGLLSAASANDQCLIFTTDSEHCIRLTKLLLHLGFDVQSMHDEMTPVNLQRALTDFRASTRPVLVATDSALSSFDVQPVDCVISYDTPQRRSNAIRTNRCKSQGQSIALVSQYEVDRLHELEQFVWPKLTQHPMQEAQVMVHLDRVTEAQRAVASADAAPAAPSQS